jgi:hypothetical protein
MSIRSKFEPSKVEKLGVTKENMRLALSHIRNELDEMLRHIDDAEKDWNGHNNDNFHKESAMQVINNLICDAHFQSVYDILLEYQKVLMEFYEIDQEGRRKR